MKHGDKAKAKSAKAKASGKEARSKKSGAKVSKGAEKGSSAAKAVRAQETGARKTVERYPPVKGGNGKGKIARPTPGTVGFTNPIIAEAFRRAVKKYPTAFRRLTD